MKKTILLLLAVFATLAINAQNCYWVLLANKNGTSFDPYSYFDAKAIERYQLNNADLYDISNYPLNESYVKQINAIAIEEVGQSRWLNAIAVMATDDQIKSIEQLPFVTKVDLIATNMEIAECAKQSKKSQWQSRQEPSDDNDNEITPQLLRMKGDIFIQKGIDGSGIRIAVFDGGFKSVNTHAAFKHLRDNNRRTSTTTTPTAPWCSAALQAASATSTWAWPQEPPSCSPKPKSTPNPLKKRYGGPRLWNGPTKTEPTSSTARWGTHKTVTTPGRWMDAAMFLKPPTWQQERACWCATAPAIRAKTRIGKS